MRRYTTTLMSAIGLGALALGAPSAMASSDFGPGKTYALIQSDTVSNLPFLQPWNDSRVSLLLLLSDAGLARAHLPLAAVGQPARKDPYAAQTPLDLDTFAAVYDDRPPVSADDTSASTSPFTEGQGDRCRSNAGGSDSFLAALKASTVPAAEQTVLAKARQSLAVSCGTAAEAAVKLPAGTVRSAQGKAFATYLAAAGAFYAADFAPARQGFAAAGQSTQPWVREASRYMVARVDVNAAQMNAFGDYGELTLKSVDVKAVVNADTEFRNYLHDYPQGAYAVSARGLLRRTAWLGANNTLLADEFGKAFDSKSHTAQAVDLAYEADNKLLGQAEPSQIHEPRLLAALDLMRMRRTDGKPAALGRADLEGQRAVFAGQKDLYDYLLAAYAFYDEGNAAAALKMLDRAEPSAHMSSLQFSAQMLKGLALEATRKPAAARAQWLALMPLAEPVLQRPAVELALAQNYERAGEVAAVFAANSPIHDPTYREMLLTNSAAPELLRQRVTAADAPAHERNLALYTLLVKEVTRGRYQAFLDDLRLMPANPSTTSAFDKLGVGSDDSPALAELNWAGSTAGGDFPCPSLKVTATALARTPKDQRSLVCLGEFMRVNNYDGFLRQDNPPPAPGTPAPPVQLSSTAAQFPGIGLSRLDVYKAIINDPKAAPDLRAYALYRAVNCWAPAGINGCDSSDAPKSQRKQWYEQLKSQYRDTGWASSLKYYW